jgi:molybdopterin converting factor subunit 1
MDNKNIHIQYFAILREQNGKTEETVLTNAQTAEELYTELKIKYKFTLSTDLLRVAINNAYSSWNETINNNDKITFIPPVAGG